MASGLLALIERAITERFQGNASDLVRAVGISDSTLSKLRKKKTNSLNWDNLLRLSLVLGLPASDVLRLAGKGPEADLIENCYGPARPVSPAVRDLVEILEMEPRVAKVLLPSAQALQEELRSQSTEDTRNASPQAAVSGTPRRRAAPSRKVR